MAGSIIDADKLQNEQFMRYDWLIINNGKRDTIVLQRTETEIKQQTKLLSHMVKNKYDYKKVKVTIEDVV